MTGCVSLDTASQLCEQACKGAGLPPCCTTTSLLCHTQRALQTVSVRGLLVPLACAAPPPLGLLHALGCACIVSSAGGGQLFRRQQVGALLPQRPTPGSDRCQAAAAAGPLLPAPYLPPPSLMRPAHSRAGHRQPPALQIASPG